MESSAQFGQPDHHLVEYLPTKRKNNEQKQREICNPCYAQKQKTLLLLDDYYQPCKKYKESDSSHGSSSRSEKEKEVAAAMDQSSVNYSPGLLYLIKTDYNPKPLTQPIWKNNRRCWSSELHERFVEALNLLGGIEVATPKQIRDLMQVEELTIDQVKSHLQVKFF
ncbi:hypothetical protein PTKIN_Ptkin12aG0027400 [Pterospermum kingtungense]